MKNLLPYPLRATKISIDLNPFGFWWPEFVWRRDLIEAAKEGGARNWWIRFAWFQISYSRWV